MTDEQCDIAPDHDELIAKLATLEEAAETGATDSAADSTVKQLRDELDTLLTDVRQTPPVDEFEEESGCRRAIELVREIGKDPLTTQADAPSADVSQGEELGSLRDYQLLSKLGQGGMGTVYKALHTKLDKVVAIKLLPSDKLRDAHAVSRFEREMKAVGKLEHPNIVRATDAGEVDGQHFLVMEHVDGVDLSTAVRAVGPLAIADACEVVRQVAVGLQHAHEHGLVHRDIKPSNIMLNVVASLREADNRSRSERPTVKILDMGLALLEEQRLSDQRDLTTTGQMMGTLDYMAPEQGVDSHDVDIRADIYALGATLFKLLCGEAPFTGKKYKTPMQVLIAIANDPATSIADKRDDVPAELAVIVDRMLQKSPDDRFATPREVAEALEPFVAGCDLAALGQRAERVIDSEAESLSRTNEYLSSPSTETEAGAIAPVASASERTQRLEKTQLAVTLPNTAVWYRRPAFVTTVALGVLGLLLLAVVIHITTDKGELIVHSDDDNVQVTVKHHNGEVVEDIELTRGKGQTALRSGKYEVVITDDNADQFTIKPNLVTLSRNGKEVVTIERKALETVGTTNHGLEFDGTNHVEVPTLVGEFGELCTVEAWVRAGTSDGVVLHFHSGWLQVFKDKWRGGRAHSKGLQAQLDSSSANRENVIHLACVIESEEPKLFVNGHEQRTTLLTAEEVNPVHPLYIGCSVTNRQGRAPANFFKGTIDEVRISNIARYAEDFTPAQRFEPDEHTLALYHFNEGAGDVLKDSSGNKHHGKIVGAKWVKSVDAATSSPPSEDSTAAFQGDGITASLVGTLGQHGGVNGLAFSPDGTKLLTTAHGSWPANATVKGSAKLWDVASRRDLLTVEDKTFGLLGPAFSPDGKLFSIGAKGWAKTFNTETGQEEATFLSRYDTFWGTTFSPNGLHFATASINHKIQLWEVSTGNELKNIDAHGNRLYEVRYSPNGNLIASCAADGLIKLWDAQTLELLQTLTGHTSRVPTVAFRSDGSELISGSWDGTIRIWDTNTGAELRTLRSHTDRIGSVDLSPDGSTLASASEDGTIKLWDLEYGKLLLTIDGQHGDAVTRICFSPNGMFLASAHHTIKLWKLEHESPAGAAASLRLLTPAPDNAPAKSGVMKPDVAEVAIDFEAERKAAEWVLSIGGKVFVSVGGDEALWLKALNGLPLEHLQSALVDDVKLLPEADFLLTYADISKIQAVRDGDFANLRGLKALRALNASYTELTNNAADHLAGVTTLTHVLVPRTKIRDDGFENFASSSLLELAIRYTSDTGLLHLASQKRLKWLTIQRNDEITDDGLRHLKDLRALRTLVLEASRVTDDGLAHLASLKLETLSLRYAQVAGAGFVHLKSMPLRNLHLNETRTSDLSSLAAFRSLENLDLENTLVTDEQMHHLKDIDVGFSLALNGTQISDAGIVALGAKPNLAYFGLASTKVTDATLKHVESLPALQGVGVWGTQVTLDGIATLLLVQPNCKIHSGFTDEQVTQAVARLRASSTSTVKPAETNPNPPKTD